MLVLGPVYLAFSLFTSNTFVHPAPKEEGENPYEGQFRGGKALIFPSLGTLKQVWIARITGSYAGSLIKSSSAVK
jgi:hypothetical protein